MEHGLGQTEAAKTLLAIWPLKWQGRWRGEDGLICHPLPVAKATESRQKKNQSGYFIAASHTVTDQVSHPHKTNQVKTMQFKTYKYLQNHAT
jgi:hypothetical protein